MIRVLHTSDWHIGRRFKGVDLLEYQRKALQWLANLIDSEHVDVLCVAGDVYDSPRPSTEAVRLFNDIFAMLGRMRSTVTRWRSSSRQAITIRRIVWALVPR